MGQTQRISKNNTKVVKTDDLVTVQLHATIVVAFNPTTKVTRLDSNNWRTTTTKTRMNQTSNEYGLGWSVFQKNHKWFVSRSDGSVVPYQDGIILNVG
jgi:hypothetical protein